MSAADRWARVRQGAARYERLFWIGAIAAVLIVQWPMVKGLYYRTADAPPESSRIEWRTDLDAALAESRRTGRPVLADFSADWCPPCIAMQHDVWPDDRVEQAVIGGYVPLVIDVDRDVEASGRYGVRAIPTILVLDGDGRVLRRATFLSASGMREFLAPAP